MQACPITVGQSWMEGITLVGDQCIICQITLAEMLFCSIAITSGSIFNTFNQSCTKLDGRYCLGGWITSHLCITSPDAALSHVTLAARHEACHLHARVWRPHLCHNLNIEDAFFPTKYCRDFRNNWKQIEYVQFSFFLFASGLWVPSGGFPRWIPLGFCLINLMIKGLPIFSFHRYQMLWVNNAVIFVVSGDHLAQVVKPLKQN